MIDPLTVVTILLMAAVTYLTRVSGYLLLCNRTLGRRATAVMEATPGCVLISVIAPHFVSSRPPTCCRSRLPCWPRAASPSCQPS
jgi:uncharacterized membrane protein